MRHRGFVTTQDGSELGCIGGDGGELRHDIKSYYETGPIADRDVFRSRARCVRRPPLEHRHCDRHFGKIQMKTALNFSCMLQEIDNGLWEVNKCNIVK